MHEEIRRIGASLRALVTRAKVTQAAIGPRTILQVTGLDNESFDGVELLLPFGMVAAPAAGSDVLLLQVNGSRDHKVALAGDNTGDAFVALRPGEAGLSIAGQSTLLRATGIETVSPIAAGITAPTTTTSGNLVAGVGATGSFTTPTGQVVTVRDGLITNIF